MWDDQTERIVDAAIDRIAREMTAGAPAPSVRARVIAQIEGAPSRRTVGHFVWMVPAAVAVVLVLAFGVWRRTDRPGVSTPQRARQQETAHDAARQNPEPGTPNPEARTERTVNPNRTRKPAPGTQNPAGAPAPSAVAALAPPSLTVPRLGVAALESPRSIELLEMTVSSLDVAPLATEERPR
jgi:hypothetical protein